ncbi:MAG: tRNA (N(6)-L-threonylcarbamoyladenosine(37)-C(2))-methylthiotransferase MtaB [bacterium]|nr:tRNA (N(6)-L-threonylcarbamoyladenosine(37)-C(2))-methylthiotransferase MtaB [bacterium]
MKTYIIKTFGCKVNQYDSAEIARGMESAGYSQHSDRDNSVCPSIIIINGCTVTHNADRRVRASLKKYSGRYPKTRLVLTGCSAAAPYFKAEEVDFVRIRKENFSVYVSGLKCPHKNKRREIKEFERTRALLKIQDGCDNFCSYCIVPSVRGLPKSRSSEEVMKEAESLSEKGFKEIVVTGINISAYRDSSASLRDLLGMISEIEGIRRIRLSSIEPSAEINRIIPLFKRGKPFCPHFHIPLQSASDKILELMGRKYSFSDYMAYVENIRNALENVTISTDIIVGYPGETESDFHSTLDAVKKIKFVKVHVFPFSPRKGTKAFYDRNRLSPEIIGERVKEVTRESDFASLRIKEELKGKEAEVLVENGKSDIWSGFTENYLRVFINAETGENKTNKIIKIKLASVAENGMFQGIYMPGG